MSSGFVTESEINEARQRRQEEWEKVRQPDEPLGTLFINFKKILIFSRCLFISFNTLERPEEPYDGRSLFDRLKEQKMKKDMEYEEAHKLSYLLYLNQSVEYFC